MKYSGGVVMLPLSATFPFIPSSRIHTSPGNCLTRTAFRNWQLPLPRLACYNPFLFALRIAGMNSLLVSGVGEQQESLRLR